MSGTLRDVAAAADLVQICVDLWHPDDITTPAKNSLDELLTDLRDAIAELDAGLTAIAKRAATTATTNQGDPT